MTRNHYLCVFLYVYSIECAKILGVFPVPSISHQIVFQPIWKELSLRGHEVTVITPNPLRDALLSNLTEIDVSSSAKRAMDNSNIMKNLDITKSVFSRIMFGNHLLDALVKEELEQEEVSELIKSDETFDLIILQVFAMQPVVYGFGARFGSPIIIGISTLEVFLHTHDTFGNPTHALVTPDMMLGFKGDLTFANKVESLLFNIWYRMLYYWYALPNADKVARKYFGEDIPYLGDIERNTSLLLVNLNPIMHGVRPNVPNVIEINQIHIKKKKPLPGDIQKYLDSSPQGIVYFSLGSNVKSANLTESTRDVIIRAMAELPYKVLWKWENDYLPGKPDNVMIRKWLPQQDVLGHPHIKVFVTQGGLQSIEESITNGVPMIGLPFMSDQPTNVKRITELGMGLGLDYRTMNKEQLRDAIIEVAENKKYKDQVNNSRMILVDQPMKGVEKAVWWIEYVLRHKGAKHLRSAAADMSFYEYFMIDVICFLLVCVSFSIYATIRVYCLVVWSVRKPRSKVKSN
ncbi:unnamed protein product [Phaedon cochleariae]|uniref:UDP-glucuronosyltransferase n=1 Tax=Phaedon cochleariae TaxID=80249 RepID=A0A9N9SFH4_PHACE|nr:unnamed protein product [Phaedon cochleariae]